MRENSHNENDLDSIRKQRTSNEIFTLLNLKNKMYEHMMTEPQTQKPNIIESAKTIINNVEEVKKIPDIN